MQVPVRNRSGFFRHVEDMLEVWGRMLERRHHIDLLSASGTRARSQPPTTRPANAPAISPITTNRMKCMGLSFSGCSLQRTTRSPGAPATIPSAGSSSPSALAVMRLITSSNFVGCSTGRSAGLARATTSGSAALALTKNTRPRPRTPSARRASAAGARRSTSGGWRASWLGARDDGDGGGTSPSRSWTSPMADLP